ncbi:hypothetical protein MAPG_00169 [Magnaporthiopsis poae ATCC 64411]|uniref:Aldehyde dehydrogenase domain-containing protein n=1 Tax=Magnaporthiopsis poae (strain ATCC 64411 / 73-15) TaxID=644358 RepID=A0A0C4DKA4_MAGP6|nr:hypothetical protein MAPG_00169 [Magnaporthiopsis poae ATCC 64411]
MASADKPSSLPFTLSNLDLVHFDNYVNGEFVPSISKKRFDVVDPGTGQSWASCPDSVPEDADQAVTTANVAFQAYSKWTPRKRAEALARWHSLIVAARDDLAKILVHETGKPLAEAYGELDYATSFTWGLDKAEELFDDAVAKGATPVLGNGKRAEGGPGRGGYFMAPTVLTGLTDDMAMSHDEIFAPVLGIYRFETEDEAVRRANDTSMGLASYVFTKNVDRLWRMFEKLEAGMIGLNAGNSSATEAPFGGIKESGHGKESGKDVAVDEFLVTKIGTLAVEDHY